MHSACIHPAPTHSFKSAVPLSVWKTQRRDDKGTSLQRRFEVATTEANSNISSYCVRNEKNSCENSQDAEHKMERHDNNSFHIGASLF